MSRRPTHVLVASSDGEKLLGEEWITLEQFATFFTWRRTIHFDADGPSGETHDICAKSVQTDGAAPDDVKPADDGVAQ